MSMRRPGMNVIGASDFERAGSAPARPRPRRRNVNDLLPNQRTFVQCRPRASDYDFKNESTQDVAACLFQILGNGNQAPQPRIPEDVPKGMGYLG